MICAAASRAVSSSVEPGHRIALLEFDHVIVVEPAEIVRSGERGPHRLYVVLTRAVSRLDVLHAEPLPEFFLLGERGGDAATRRSPARSA